MEKIKLAIFDLDYTILNTDSTYHFFIEIVKVKPLSLIYLPISVFWGIIHLFGGIDRTRFKEIFFTPLKYLTSKEFSAFQERLIKKCLKYVKKEATEKIEAHRKEGHTLMMISASPEFYVKGIAEHFGFDYCIGTRMKFNRKKVWIEGKNCKSQEKVKRLKELIDISTVDLENSVSYSDSRTDIPLLKLTGKGYLVDEKKWELKEV